MSIVEPAFGNIPIELIRPSHTNPRKRFDEAALAELARSIKQSGVGQPILVRPLPDIDDDVADRVEIVAGERRYRASKLAGLTTIPAIVRDMSDVEVLEFQLVENLQREDVHPIEEAEGYERLMKEHKFTADECADKVGKSRSYIYGRLKFCALAPEARTAFYDGKLNASTALLVARIPVKSLQIKAANEIANGYGSEPLSYRAAVAHVHNRYMLDLVSAPFSIISETLKPDAGPCTTCPKRTGNQPEIFPDLDNADVCTDPDCFGLKRKTHNDLVLAKAEEKGVPIYSINDARKLIQEGNLVAATDALYNFERVAPDNNGTRYNPIQKLLPKEQRPEPVGYIKRDNGEMEPIYEKTAIQLALEKAGLCLTLEQHTAAMQEKLERGEVDEDKFAERIERERQQQEAENKAVLATKFRTTLYKQIRTAAINGEMNEDILCHAIKMLMLDSEMSSEAAEFYSIDMRDEAAVEDFLDYASAAELTVFLLDLAIGHSLSVRTWHLRHDDYEQDAPYLSLLTLAKELSIDPDAVREEVTPKPEPEAPATGDDEQDGCSTQDAPAPTAKSKKKGKAEAKATKSDADRTAPWPFPSGARP